MSMKNAHLLATAASAAMMAGASARSAMYADEEAAKTPEEERKDASAGTQESTEIMDAVTRCMDAVERMADSFGKRFDRMDTRLDAAEEELKREDRRKDGEEDEGEKKEELKADKRKDGEEDDDKAERVVADKRKDGEDEGEKKEELKADKRKDANDGDEDDKRETHGDAAGPETLAAIRAEMATLRAENRDLRRIMPKPINDADSAALLARQAIADDVYLEHGQRAPSPLVNEDLSTYRRRLAIDLQKHSTTLKNADLWAVADDTAFDALERQVYADALHAARNPVTVGLGALRGVTRQSGGHTFTEYHGDSAGWMGELSLNAVRGKGSVTEVMRAMGGSR